MKTFTQWQKETLSPEEQDIANQLGDAEHERRKASGFLAEDGTMSFPNEEARQAFKANQNPAFAALFDRYTRDITQ